MVKIAKSYWDVGRYSMVAIGLMWLHKCGFRMFSCLLFCDG